MRRWLGIGTSSLLIVLTAQSAASTCVHAPTGLATLTESDAVFTGIVLAKGERKLTGDERGNRPVIYEYRIAVDAVWKGEVADTQLVDAGLKGSSLAYHFDIGAAYFICASRVDDQLHTGECSGTRPLSAAENELRALPAPLRQRPYSDAFSLKPYATCVSDPGCTTRVAAIGMLGVLAPVWPEVIPELARIAREGPWAERNAALRGLSGLASVAKISLPIFQEALGSGREDTRIEAAVGLLRTALAAGDTGLVATALIPARLRTGRGGVWWQLLQQSREQAEALMDYWCRQIMDPDRTRALQAAQTMEGLGLSVSTLYRCVADQLDVADAGARLRALRFFTAAGPSAVMLRDRVRECLTDPDSAVRAAAEEAVRSLSEEP